MDWGQLVRFHLPKSHVAYSMKLIINQMDRKLVKSQNQSGREIKKEVVACEDCGTAALESLCAGAFWHWMPKSQTMCCFVAMTSIM